MRQLLNTLFVTSEDIYLSLDGENVVASREHQEAARYPLHTLSGIVSFSYPGASPALMGACAERGISLAFCTPRGRFLARIAGSTSGNVLLRRAQYRTADELSASCRIARSMIFGKVYNARWSIERTRRDHGLRLDSASLTASASHLKELLPQIAAAASLEHLRGLEGAGATLYFGQFDQLILGEKPLFSYQSRSRRPPRREARGPAPREEAGWRRGRPPADAAFLPGPRRACQPAYGRPESGCGDRRAPVRRPAKAGRATRRARGRCP